MWVREVPTILAVEMDQRTHAVVNALATSTDVKGVICFGSVATGQADECSDVDLYVFCQPAIISKADRRGVFQSLPSVSEVELDYPGGDRQWVPEQDKFRLDGLQFDLAYTTTERIGAIVRKVKQGKPSIPELRFRAYTMLGLLENSIVLYDPESFLAELLGELYPYPKKLKERLIARSLESLAKRLNELGDTARRGIGSTAFHFHLTFVNDDMCTLLYAINEKYHPASKRCEQNLARLKVLPRDFLARYGGILTGPFDAAGQARAVAEYTRLVEEVKALI